MKIPLTPPTTNEILKREILGALQNKSKLEKIIGISPLVGGKYLHWDEVRYRTPPEGLTAEEWWLGIKLGRNKVLKTTTLLDKNGKPFVYGTPDSILRMLHEVDQLASGGIQVGEDVTNPSTRDRYIVSSLITESITSSQLEGASTTVDVAKNMLRSGRKANDRSEQMIFNNYAAMEWVRRHHGKRLTSDLVFELHRIVTADTLDDSTKAGCFRDDADAIQIEDPVGTVLHVPPPSAELAERLVRMCEFANDRPDDEFLHPVVRAIILHFWAAYDHPFVDGNGRTARALFYWSMLSQGYWLAEYISISGILKNAPAQYGRSFLYTETDANDLTYFLEYQLGVVRRAVQELEKYLARKIREVRSVEALLRESADLNHRQLAVLSHALRHPGDRYTIGSHRRSHKIVYQTARADLLELAERNLLLRSKRGREYQFEAPANLKRRLMSDSDRLAV